MTTHGSDVEDSVTKEDIKVINLRIDVEGRFSCRSREIFDPIGGELKATRAF